MADYLNQNGKKVAIIGSTSCIDFKVVTDVLDRNRERIKMIVSMDADGPDKFAVEWAKENGIPFITFPARWKDPITGQRDKGAGFRRARIAFKYSDAVLAFWDGESEGTAHYMEIAEQMDRKVKLIEFDLKKQQALLEQQKSQEEKAAESELGTHSLPVKSWELPATSPETNPPSETL
jgi:hypothetical protein